jgi:hypothetical protein
MNYNPYDPPRAALPASPTSSIVGGQPQPWDIGEVLGHSWEIFKSHWGVLLFAPIVAGVVMLIPSGIVLGLAIQSLMNDSGSASDPLRLIAALSGPRWHIASLLVQIIGAFFAVGLVRIFVTAARGETPSFSDLFGGGSRLLAMLVQRLLLGVLLVVATLFFVVPGVILYCGMWAAPYFLVDAEMGIFDAMKASWDATTGQKMELFLFFLVAFVINIAGALPCGLGLLVTAPLTALATAVIFLRISGRGPGAPPMVAAYGAYPPGYGPPGTGYGGPPQGAPPVGGGYGGPPPGAPPGYGGPGPGMG